MNNTTTSWNDTQKLLAFLIVMAFIVIILIWMFKPPDPTIASAGVLNTLVGSLGGFAAMVVTFYFGNSRSSANKDATIAALAPQPPPVNGTTTSTTVTTSPPPRPAG
jgi:hypothetical protein